MIKMWKLFLLLFLNFLQNSLSDPSIACTYRVINNLYECQLRIYNDNGDDYFFNVTGQHLPGFSNEDVRSVLGVEGNTPNIPQIICNQFVNLEQMVIIRLGLERISGLPNCQRMTSLTLSFNNINSVPGTAFSRLTNLRFLDLRYNQISSVHENAFNSLSNLTELYLSDNPSLQLPSFVFRNLRSIDLIHLSRCRLKEWHPAWFNTLTTLRVVEITNNQLTYIPKSAFNEHNRLERLGVSNNYLTKLEFDSFQTTRNLTTLFAAGNLIESISFTIFEEPRGLTQVWLNGNICTSRNFENFESNREQNMEDLNSCFEPYDNREIYIETDGTHYEWFSIRGNGTWFTVRAAHDVELILTPFRFDLSHHVQIFIGRDNNTRSAMRENGEERTSATTNGILDPEVDVEFVIQWGETRPADQVQTIHDYAVFMALNVYNLTVNHIGVRTSGNVGIWRFVRIADID